MTPRAITGRCLCGAVTYTASGKPVTTAVCHCDDCQRQSGSAYSIFVALKSRDVVIDGELATYETVGTDNGLRRDRRFCPRCGSPVLSVLEEAPELVFLKAGTLDDRSWLRPRIEFWRATAQAWTRRPVPRLRLRRGPSARATKLLTRKAR